MAKRARGKKKGSRYDQAIGAGIVITVIAIVLMLWGPVGKVLQRQENSQQAKKQKAPAASQKERQGGEEPSKKQRDSTTGSAQERALVAIVIDDLGQDLKQARELLAIPAKLTFAVMPGLPQSEAVAHLARKNNREVLLHIPMEHRNPNGKKEPRGILRSDMTPMDFLTTINDNIASVPGAIGVNNHEGSLLTENSEAMKFLMAELKSRNLFFLDSLTTPRSVAFAVAKEFGLRSVRRDVFLDNDNDDEKAIRTQLEELSRIALKRGRATGIGHPHPATISAIRKWLASASKQGIEIVPVSTLMQ